MLKAVHPLWRRGIAGNSHSHADSIHYAALLGPLHISTDVIYCNKNACYRKALPFSHLSCLVLLQLYVKRCNVRHTSKGNFFCRRSWPKSCPLVPSMFSCLSSLTAFHPHSVALQWNRQPCSIGFRSYIVYRVHFGGKQNPINYPTNLERPLFFSH